MITVTFGKNKKLIKFEALEDALNFVRDLPEVAHVTSATITDEFGTLGWLKGNEFVWVERLVKTLHYCMECGSENVRGNYCRTCGTPDMVVHTNEIHHKENLQ